MPFAGIQFIDAIPENIRKYRFAIGCKRHYFIFIRRMKKAQVRGHSLIQQSKRMGHLYLAEADKVVTVSKEIGSQK